MDIFEEIFGDGNENDSDNVEHETGEPLQDVMESPDVETNTPPPSEEPGIESWEDEDNSESENAVTKYILFQAGNRYSYN